MSTTIIVEQRLPVSIQLLSRISTYAHVFEVSCSLRDVRMRDANENPLQSVLATILFWLFPSLGPPMPELQIVSYRRRRASSVSIHSLKSTASTLVDEDMTEGKDNDMDSDKDCKHHRYTSFDQPLIFSPTFR
jgi:hypothetical protein